MGPRAMIVRLRRDTSEDMWLQTLVHVSKKLFNKMMVTLYIFLI